MKADVYQHADPKEFLRAILKEKQRRNPRVSIRAWSRQLGFSTPSYLSDVLSGQRHLTPKLAALIASQLGMTPPEASRFGLLTLRALAKTAPEQRLYSDLLEKMGARPNWIQLRLDQFKVIADWYHWVVLEMPKLKGFDPDPSAIASRLGGKVSTRLISQAIRRLLQLGLVRSTSAVGWDRTQGDPYVGDTIPSEAIQEHHRQFLKKAAEALSTQNIEERDFRGSTFAFRRAELGKARQIIRRCHKELRDLESAVDADDIYRFNSQFFRLTVEADK